MGADPATLDAAAVTDYSAKAQEAGVVEFLLAIIPDTLVGAFTGGSDTSIFMPCAPKPRAAPLVLDARLILTPLARFCIWVAPAPAMTVAWPSVAA